MSIINKKIKIEKCYHCEGKGCNKCNFTGMYEEQYCYYIDDKKNICFDSEPGK